MDLLTLKKALKGAKNYTDSAISQIVISADDGDYFDRTISVGLLLNYIRQNEDAWTEKGFTVRSGSVTLTNSLQFPFNDSQETVAISPVMPDTDYAVIPFQ